MTITPTFSIALLCGAIAMALNSLFIRDNSHQPAALPPLTTGPHEYFRPSDDQVWGLPGNTSFAYFRSPCPALNALANHGHIPRDGKDLTPVVLGHAIMKVYNFDKTLLDLIFLALPSIFTLADLGDPNFIDHDASLVHVDSFFQVEPFKVNMTLVDEFLSMGEDIGNRRGRVLTKRSVARFRRHREIECAHDNPEFSMSALASFVAYGEASFILLGLGDYTTSTISVDHARSFLVNERIPTHFRPSKTPITVTRVLFAIAELAFRA
ncbi:Chloroperoxidase [Phytophthora megakarya]|uniref:Chloroperoxidase n=1 Tax=Phytophthora megakarya TaxID=4795 RepID=A0A225VS32_9STRA|nr:Chloroperoxidase [Phytophthora megakarya]